MNLISIVVVFGLLMPVCALGQSLVLAAKKPDVHMVIFAAFDCAYCAQAQAQLDDLRKKYPSQLNIQFKHFPLQDSDDGYLSHEAALAAAAQGKFAAMHDALYAATRPLNRAGIERIAKSLDLDMLRFRGDLDQHLWRSRIEDDVREARGFGVKVTPTFFVAGYKLEGLQRNEVFEEIISHQLDVSASASDSARVHFKNTKNIAVKK